MASWVHKKIIDGNNWSIKECIDELYELDIVGRKTVNALTEKLNNQITSMTLNNEAKLARVRKKFKLACIAFGLIQVLTTVYFLLN